MKLKLGYLIALILMATLGVFVFQVIWLQNSYRLTKEKIKNEAKTIVEESIIEHREIVADSVRLLLKKAINPNDIETQVAWKMPDSVHVVLALRTRGYPNGSWETFKVSKKEIKKVQANPLPMLLKRINKADLDILSNLYSTFVGVVNYKPNTWEEQLQDSLMRCFNLHEDTLTLNKMIKKRFQRLNYQLSTQVVFQKGIEEIYNKKSVVNTVLQSGSTQVVEMVNNNWYLPLNEQLDSLNSYVQKLAVANNKIYIVKPILNGISNALDFRVPFIVLKVDINPTDILKQMLGSIVGSCILLLLIGTSLTYMFYTIVKQKKLAAIKDDFIGNVSHELKTPVSIALAAIQGMQHFDVLKDKVKTDLYLDTSAKEMKRLSAMIDNILNSSIYERSDFNLHINKFNLREMLTEMINIQKVTITKKVDIELSYTAKEEVFADKAHLYNVFTNLVDNAVKYSREEVEIKIECIERIDGIKIYIYDNGKGIPQTYQKHIFDKFFRVPSPNDHSVKGHGLGLNYVKNIIEKHNGKIKLIKSDVNGSTFEIDLPQ